MKPRKLIISQEALADLEAIWDFIACDTPQQADHFIDTIYNKCRFLALNPEIGRIRNDLGQGLRSFPVRNYLIFYRIKGSNMEVIRIISGYRQLDI